MASPILAGLTILMLGDSHFATQGYLVNTLQDALMQQGAKVTTYAACGAPAGVFAGGGLAPCGSAMRVNNGPLKKDTSSHAHVPPFPEIIDAVHPNLIIIGGGDTMAGYAQATMPVEYLQTEIRQLVGRIQSINVPCVWIGPGWGTEGGPFFKNYARVQQVSDFLASHVSPCRYIDSLQFSKPGEWATFDGQHYTPAGYQKWGAAIDQAILALAQSH